MAKNQKQGAMHQYNVGAPFDRTTIGISGPFPESDNGNIS